MDYIREFNSNQETNNIQNWLALEPGQKRVSDAIIRTTLYGETGIMLFSHLQFRTKIYSIKSKHFHSYGYRLGLKASTWIYEENYGCSGVPS